LECFDLHLGSLLIKDWPEFKRCFKRISEYGDDVVIGYDIRAINFICNGNSNIPAQLRDYLKSRFFMQLKMEETYVLRDTDDREDETLSCFFSQAGHDIGGIELSYKGVKYLKRYFVRSRDGYAYPWRPTVDYIHKSTCVPMDNQDIATHLIRLRSLACDCYGTNLRAHNFLQRYHDFIISSLPNLSEITNEIRLTLAIYNENEDKLSNEQRKFLRKLGGLEGVRLILNGFPSYGEIFARVKYDQEEQDRRRWARHARLDTVYPTELTDDDEWEF